MPLAGGLSVDTLLPEIVLPRIVDLQATTTFSGKYRLVGYQLDQLHGNEQSPVATRNRLPWIAAYPAQQLQFNRAEIIA